MINSQRDEPAVLLTRVAAADDQAAAQTIRLLRDAAERAATTEHGFVKYEVFEDRADPTTLYIIETWQTAADAHRHELLAADGDGPFVLNHLLRDEITTRTLRSLLTTRAGGLDS